jgi:hypothetical protein
MHHLVFICEFLELFLEPQLVFEEQIGNHCYRDIELSFRRGDATLLLAWLDSTITPTHRFSE